MQYVLISIGIAFGAWVIVSLPFYKMGYEGSFSSLLDEPRTKSNWNAIALFVNIRNGELKLPEIPKRKTGIDKEIEDEEKEIAELEWQKEKMDRLAELKRRKERLFRDLGEEQRMMCTCGREFHSIDNYKEHLTNCFES